MKTDIQIAQEAKLEHIRDVAARIGISEDDLEFYGKYTVSYTHLPSVRSSSSASASRGSRCSYLVAFVFPDTAS